jgi:hypothetical protein
MRVLVPDRFVFSMLHVVTNEPPESVPSRTPVPGCTPMLARRRENLFGRDYPSQKSTGLRGTDPLAAPEEALPGLAQVV